LFNILLYTFVIIRNFYSVSLNIILLSINAMIQVFVLKNLHYYYSIRIVDACLTTTDDYTTQIDIEKPTS
jgi:hypothetical protein